MTQESKLKVAEQALHAWQDGARTGDWSALIGMLAENACVTMPFVERRRGPKQGPAEAKELFRHAADDLTIRLDQQPTGGILTDGADRFAWELVGEGTVGGKPARVPICLWFTIRDDRVAVIKEAQNKRSICRIIGGTSRCVLTMQQQKTRMNCCIVLVQRTMPQPFRLLIAKQRYSGWRLLSAINWIGPSMSWK